MGRSIDGSQEHFKNKGEFLTLSISPYAFNRSGQGSSRWGERGNRDGRTKTVVACTGNRFEICRYNWVSLVPLEHWHMWNTSKHCTAWSNKVSFWFTHSCIHLTFTYYMKTLYSNSQNHHSAVSILLGSSVEFSISTVIFFSFLKSLVMFVACSVFSCHIHFWIYYSIPNCPASSVGKAWDSYYSIPLLYLSANIEYTFKSFILPILEF